MGEGREWLPELDSPPEEQALRFLAIVIEGRLRIGEAGEPGLDGIDVVGRRDQRPVASRAVGTLGAIEVRSNEKPFDGHDGADDFRLREGLGHQGQGRAAVRRRLDMIRRVSVRSSGPERLVTYLPDCRLITAAVGLPALTSFP